MPLQKTGSLPPEMMGLPSCSFFREPDSQAWRPKIPASEQPVGFNNHQVCGGSWCGLFFAYKSTTSPGFHGSGKWLNKMAFLRKVRILLEGRIFHFHEGVFQVSKTYLSRISSRDVTWMGSFPHEGCCCWSKGCGNLHFKISREPSQFFQLQEISQKKCTISITQRMNQRCIYLPMFSWFLHCFLKETCTRWWQLKYFFMFTPKIGEDEPILTIAYFSKGLVKNPPTRIKVNQSRGYLDVYTRKLVNG